MRYGLGLALVLAVAPQVHAQAAGAPLAAASMNPLAAAPLDGLTATRERPLFSPTRRPPPRVVEAAPVAAAPAADAAAAAPTAPPFDWIGSVVGEINSYVLLRNRATSEVVRLRQGDELEGWRVGEVAVRAVVLEREGRVEHLGNPAMAASLATPVPMVAGQSPTR